MMNVDNAPLTTLLTTALSKSNNTRNSKSSSEPTTQQALANMGLLGSFSILTTSPSSSLPNTETTKTNSTLHNPNNAMSTQRQGPSSYELKIKMESVGAQPEQDDDLDTCPARTRAIWPRQLIPWWRSTQPQDKPPYSYATLIAYAILVSQDGRLLLNDIYQWISENYPYYSLDQRGWQNSIRHNLSLNKKWFLKVDRRPTQANPGKGCYWTLVPGSEEMFIENITQAGGHHRKHHDVGLTAELSKGHCNNIIAKQQQHQHQQQRNDLGMDDIDKTTFFSPMASKSCKSATTSSLAPMYSTFRMTSTTMESIAHDNTHCKKRSKLDCHYDDNTLFGTSAVVPAVTSTTSTKRARLDDDGDKTRSGNLFATTTAAAMGDDTQSDCDSGVDVGNEYDDGKLKTNPALGLLPSELTSTNEQALLYNVLDHFLDQLPLPDPHHLDALPSSHQWDTSGRLLHSSYASPPYATTIPSGGVFGFMNDCDMDPVLGYPSLNYYSTNGFYCGNDGQTLSGTDMKTMYSGLLTSKLDPAYGGTMMMMDGNTDNSLTMMMMPTATQENQPQQHQQQQQQVYPGDEDMANAYLTFEDDDKVHTSNPLTMADVGAGEPTFMKSSGYQQNDEYLAYPFTTMSGLLES